MTPPIFEPRVLSSSTRIGRCNPSLLDIAFDEVPAHCRLPDYTPFDEMLVTDLWVPYIMCESIIENMEFVPDHRPFWRRPSKKNGPKYRFVHPERRNEAWQ